MGKPLVSAHQSWWRLRDLVGGHGYERLTLVRTAAEMLAAARVLRDRGSSQLLEPSDELTAQKWADLQAQLWHDSHEGEQGPPGRLVSAFDGGMDVDIFRPGYFELCRQWVADCVSGGVFEQPDAMFGLIMQLAHEAGTGPASGGVTAGVSQLVAGLTDATLNDRVYCAFEGSAEVALRIAQSGAHVDLQLPPKSVGAFWAALVLAADLPVSVTAADPFDDLFREWPSVRADFSIAVVVPPFGMKLPYAQRPGFGLPLSSSETMAVALGGARAQQRSVCLLPNGFLFRASAMDQQFRDRALRQYGLSAVISLPPGAALRSSGVSASVLLFESKRPPEAVLMVEHSSGNDGRRTLTEEDILQIEALVRQRHHSESSRLVEYEELAANQFNLLPDRYVLTKQERNLHRVMEERSSMPLGDLVDLYRPQATSALAGSIGEFTDEEIPHELSVADLDEVGLARAPAKRVRTTPADSFKLRRAQLHPGDVLLVTKGSVGKVGYVKNIPPGEFWVANQSFAVLRLRRNSPLRDSRVLFRFLNSMAGQTLVQRLRVGATIPTLQMADIRQLPILIPSAATQRRIVEEVEGVFALQAQINALRGQLAERKQTIWPAGEWDEDR